MCERCSVSDAVNTIGIGDHSRKSEFRCAVSVQLHSNRRANSSFNRTSRNNKLIQRSVELALQEKD
jgi:hypothetical protein